MPLKNLYDIETAHGYKYIELHEDDITRLPFSIDLMVVSACKNGYSPTPNTIFGSLKEDCKVSLREIAKKPFIDLRESLGVWLSDEIENQAFQRIACVEMIRSKDNFLDIEWSLKNLFSLIAMADAQDIKVTNIALPILGAGNQQIPPDQILPQLIKSCQKSLENQASLKKIFFIERDSKKVDLLDTAMNEFLQRSTEDKGTLKIEDLNVQVKKEMMDAIAKLRGTFASGTAPVLNSVNEIQLRFEQGNLRAFELAILGRRLAEDIAFDILGNKSQTQVLAKNIADLSAMGIASWIVSYLHVLRIFGNVSAHAATNDNLKPNIIELNDLITLITCINRVVDFWYWNRTNPQGITC